MLINILPVAKNKFQIPIHNRRQARVSEQIISQTKHGNCMVLGTKK